MDQEELKAELARLIERIALMTEKPQVMVHQHGCICPVGAEKTCQGWQCPRRGHTIRWSGTYQLSNGTIKE